MKIYKNNNDNHCVKSVRINTDIFHAVHSNTDRSNTDCNKDL